MNRKLMSRLHKIKNIYMNIRITQKLLLGYFIIILVPTFTLEWFFYQNNYNAFIQNYLLNQQFALNTAKQNFDIQLEQISSSSTSFDDNTILKNYLLGSYSAVSESMYNYFQYIKPLFISSKLNPYLESLTIYSYKKLPLYVPNRIVGIDKINVDEGFINLIKKNINGIWRFSQKTSSEPCLDYYKMIYSSTYPYYLGILRIRTNVSQVFSNFNSLSENDLYLYDEKSNLVYRYDKQSLTLSEVNIQKLYEDNKRIQSVTLDSLSCKMIQINHADSILSYDGNRLLALLIILFLVLTSLYSLIASSITGRLRAFNNYVNKIDADSLQEFQAPVYRDEIGVVIESHNNMLKRVIQLTNENFQSQMQKKDAEYYALQAQIKPHFLYNMLENIRMSAETHHDPETADMLLTLGKHMRYSLNMKTNESTLENELYFAKNYLQMQKIRLKDKIQVEISVLTEIEKIPCPRLILQPLLENAIKHGYCIGKVLKIYIYVKDCIASDHTPAVTVELRDDGNGISEELFATINENLDQLKDDSSQHVGLFNVSSRLITFYGSKEGRLSIKSAPGQGTSVSFQLKRLSS